ncbi:MAG: protein kinase [Gemmatimonadota bacterium]
MTDSHTGRLESALAGRYKIEHKLGEGGMASVYLAEDVKHERKVALKILKPELAAVIGAERFLAEIKTTANLQHPHILPLFDSGEADGFLYYVMPYIEGESLRERLDREGQLGVEEAVRIAREVADALDYAHRSDIIHRDIKPANILLHDGRPVVADFGIALAISAAGGGRMTETGLSLGTPHYMSPEQASADRDLSARSDVYSLGCVLYEMLAGQPPHVGPSAQSILVRILTEDPRDVLELRRTVPAHVAATVMKSIEKLPADRFDSAKDFMVSLEDEGFTHAARPRTPRTTAVAAAQAPSAPWTLVRGLAAATVVLAGLAAWGWLRPEATPRVSRSDLYLGGVRLPLDERMLISPDGSTFAYSSAGNSGLYVRRADEPEFRLLAGTEGANWPDFSPSSDWIVYRDEDLNALMKVSVAGGQPLTVVSSDQASAYVADWGDDGTIVFTGPDGLFRVPETGGALERLDIESGFPSLLPGGAGVLVSTGTKIRIYDPAADSVRDLIAEGVHPTYLSTGHLLYVHPNGGLQVVPFDLGKLEVTGQPVPVLDGVGATFTSAFYSVSDAGDLVYVTGRATSAGGGGMALQLVIADLATGERSPSPLARRPWRVPRFAPDGRKVVFGGSGDPDHIFLYDVELGSRPTQLTFEGANGYALWAPDGTRVAFASFRDGSESADIYVKALDDSPPELLLSRPGQQYPLSWRDGVLLFADDAESDTPDLWMVDPSGNAAPEPYLQAEATLEEADISPDGTMVAYASDEGGERAIYVRSFPVPRQQSRVSEASGQSPRWSPDGTTLYYWNVLGEDTLFAARVQTEPTFALLSIEPVLTGIESDRDALDVHPDGRRILYVDDRPAGAGARGADGPPVPDRVIVVRNWFEEMRARLGGGNR